MRDLLGSLAVLLVIVAAVVAVGRGCTFSPGGPSVDAGAAPTVDAARELAAAASTVDFPVRRPELPPDWRANSSSTGAVGGASVVVRIGWLAPHGFAQLSQSGGAQSSVVAVETGRAEARPAGEVDVDGVRWTIYPGRREERAWSAQLGEVTVLITGSAGEEDFRVLARAVQAAPPLPSR